MPTPVKNESQKDFVSRCIKIVMDDGSAKDNKQAAAMCYSMWREHEKGKSIALSVILKTDVSAGRVRWKAIANSGEFDQQDDRFDETFFDDIVSNFWTVQDAVSRGLPAPPGYAHPEGMPVPQLDVAHYSFQLPKAERVKARAGVPTYAYRDNRKCILQGHFETTPLGQAASKSVLADEADIIKTSVGVWPDWNRVELLEDGKRVFKGGASVAYLDHLALTAFPVDAQTEITAEGQMAKSLTIKDDALAVIKDEKLVAELEQAAATKSEARSVPAQALVKAEVETPVAESVVTTTIERVDSTKETITTEKDKAADALEAERARLDAERPLPLPNPIVVPSAPEGPTVAIYESLAKNLLDTRNDVADVIKTLTTRVEALEKSIPNLASINELATALSQTIEATKATEAQKVKSALDNRGWLDIGKLYSARSAADNTVEGGARARGPQETPPQSEAVGGPIAGKFIKA